MKKTTALLALIMALATTATIAQPSGGKPPRGEALDTAGLFTELDQNSDQYISTTELTSAGISEGFARMADQNHDDLISTAELSDARFPPQADADSDGILSLAELLEFETNRPQGGPGGRPDGERPER